MAAAFDYPAVIKNHYNVGISYRRQSMGDDENGSFSVSLMALMVSSTIHLPPLLQKNTKSSLNYNLISAILPYIYYICCKLYVTSIHFYHFVVLYLCTY